MTWRVAESLLELREEIDAFAPDRSTEFDGTIGDEEHAGRKSDHNPSIKDSNGTGVVRALDVTHDPAGGLDAGRLAEHIRELGATGDKRVSYVIWNERIASPKAEWNWRRYPLAKESPHTGHVHISVSEDPVDYDSTDPWDIDQGLKPREKSTRTT